MANPQLNPINVPPLTTCSFPINTTPPTLNPQAYRDHSSASSLFWDVTQRRLVVRYRRFGITYRSCFQDWRRDRYVVLERK